MTGLLADVNLEGYLPRLVRLIEAADLMGLVAAYGLRFLSFADVGLDPAASDRVIWERCQADRLALFTENRNAHGPDSLEAVIRARLAPDSLPVITLGSVGRFAGEAGYAATVAANVADVMVALAVGDRYVGSPRVYVPLPDRPGS